MKNTLTALCFRFNRFSSWLSKISAYAAVGIMFFMTSHILIEISLRYFFDRSTYVLDELVGYGIAGMTFLSLGYALETSSLIRVNMILIKIKSKLVRLGFEVLSVVVALYLSIFLIEYFYRSVSRSFSRGTTSETVLAVPLWIPESLVIVGLVVFSISLISHMSKTIFGIGENQNNLEG